MIFGIEDGRLLPGAGGLSDEQARALRLDKHVVVTAGAGSGKTRTLARRTLRILGSFAQEAAEQAATAQPTTAPGPEAILVSTFTERAAAEMKERIRAELVHGLRELRERRAELEPAIGPVRYDAYQRHLHRCLLDFHRARVGTFHGFCAALLREFAAAAGLDPGFGVLTGGEAHDARMEAVDAALVHLDAGREDLLPLVQGMGRSATSQSLLRWLDKRDELKGFAASLEGADDEVIGAWSALGGVDLDAIDPSPLRPLLATLSSFDTPDFVLGEAAINALDAFDAAAEDPCAQGERLRRIFIPFTTTAGSLHKTMKGAGALSSADKREASAAWKALRAELVALFGEAGEVLDRVPTAADRAALPVLRALAALAADADREYTALKERRAVLDFEDLQLGLRDLLDTQPGVAELLRQRYRHVLVDEFQDTNALQWALLQRILGDPLPQAGLFLVGDPKQAIYRFRGGDVTMFATARLDLGEVENVAFTTNYRSQSALIDAFNAFFGWLMPAPDSGHPAWEAPFEPLTATRDGEGLTELLWLEEGDVGDEAALIVERMPELLQSTEPHQGLQVALLFRRRKHIGLFAAALRAAGIPHVVARGRGFFSRQEVLDVSDLLVALAHPDDGVALVGALRGPFLALEDAWLLWLARTGGHGPDALRRGWDGVVRGVHRADRLPEGWGELPHEGQRELLRAAADWLRWRELRRRLPLSAFLRAVLDDTAAVALLARQDPTGQAVANLEKLLSLAVSFDSAGPEGLAEFGRHLRDQGEAEADEGEALLDATAPVVLMTIHQSKGLEFPAVILPDLASPMGFPMSDRAAVGRLGRETIVGLNTELPDGSRRKSLLRRLLLAQDGAEQRAEAKRLLYVAATRARDRLICTMVPSKKYRGVDGSTHWQEWIGSWTEEQSTPEGVVLVEDLRPDPIQRSAAAAAAPPAAATLHRALAPLPRHREPILTPSGLPVDDLAPASRGVAGPTPSDPRLLGLARGRLVHECIEDGLLVPGPATAARVDHALAGIGRLDPAHQQWMSQELAQHLDGYRRAAPPEGLREVPFQLPLGDGRWLRGAIDLLYRAEHGWVVLDYKSDRADDEALAQHYRPQLVAYAWAASRILPEVRAGGTVSAELLLTASGRRIPVLPPSDAATLEGALRAALPPPHGGARTPP